MNKKFFAAFAALAMVATVGAGCLAGEQNGNTNANTNVTPEPEPVACTQEAKICPDGSSVGRSGPDCEFAPCPEGGDYPLKTFTDETQGIEFQYPETLTAKYIKAQEWPPKVTVTAGEFSCLETSPTDSISTRVAQRLVDDRVYCVTAASEGAAGSVYTTYGYTTLKEGKLISVSFILRYPQCLNYDDPQKSECQAERETFDLDGIIDRIAASVKFK